MNLFRFFLCCVIIEIKYLVKNRFDFFMIVIAPLLTVILLYSILSAEQLVKIPIAVVDYNDSSLSRNLISLLNASPALKVEHKSKNNLQIQNEIHTNKIAAIITIDKNFSEDIKHSRQAQLALQHNAHQSSISSAVQNAVKMVVQTMSAGIKMQIANKRGQAKQLGLEKVEPIIINLEPLFNPTLNFAQMLLTSLIFAVFHILSISAGADFIGRLFSDASLPQWLENTQNKLIQIVLKLIALMLVCITPIFVIGSVCLLIFNFYSINPKQGAIVSVMLAMIPFLSLSFVIGVLFSTLMQSRRLGLSLSAFYAAPAFAFSGVSFPIIAMTKTTEIWAHLSPFMHFAKILTQQLQLILPRSSILFSSISMFLLTILSLVLSASLLRKNATNMLLWQERL